MGDLANEAFAGEDLKGFLIGGPGATKDAFLNGSYLHHELKGLVLGPFDTGYTDEYGLRELVGKAQDTLSDLALMREKDLVQKLFDEIRKPHGGLAAYGEEEVLRALTSGAVDTLLVSETLRKDRVSLRCASCGHTEERTVEAGSDAIACPECGAAASVGERADFVDHLQGLAEASGSTLEIVSGESEEGQLLMKAFGGLAALLRFRVS